MDNINETMKQYGGNVNAMAGPVKYYGFSVGAGPMGGGGLHPTPKFIITFFCDISLLIILSNKLLSHLLVNYSFTM
tara:strand:+ start:449 stop:676 length:228 start_codon:yes stop_codon:yes gene_type:complete